MPFFLELLSHLQIKLIELWLHVCTFRWEGTDCSDVAQVIKENQKKIDILTLATIGLDMDEDGVDGILRDNKDEIHMAVYNVLKVWKRSQPDSKTAFTNLCAALRNKNVNMEYLIDDTLQ